MRAISKIILFGEHSVVYGKKAIAMPVKNIYLEVKKQSHFCYESDHLKYIKSLVGIKEYIKVKSKIPIASGMGSSAALSIAIARLANLDAKKISDLAEKKAHGNPSGVDANVIINEKSLIFEKGKQNIYIDIDMSASLLLIYTNISSKTIEAVNKVKKANREDLIDELGIITEKAIENISDKFFIAKLMKKAQKNLKELGVSTEKIDNLIKKIEYDSLACKITGAGLGGCLIALCKNSIQADKLKRKLKKKGYDKVWKIKV